MSFPHFFQSLLPQKRSLPTAKSKVKARLGLELLEQRRMLSVVPYSVGVFGSSGSLSAGVAYVGQQLTLAGLMTSSDSPTNHTVQIDWGDGNHSTVTPNTWGTFTANHTFSNESTFSIAATDGSGTAQGTMVIVRDDARISLSPLSNVTMGSPATLTGTFTKNYGSGTPAVVIDWGDSTTPSTVNVSGGLTATHTYTTYGSGFTIRVTDRDGSSGASEGITVSAQPAVVSLNPVSAAIEGQMFYLGGSVSTPGRPEVHAVRIDWGDGSSPTSLSMGSGSSTLDYFSTSHVYNDHGTYSITVQDLQESASSTWASAQITPAKPVITSLIATVATNHYVTLSGTVVDDNPGGVTISFGSSLSDYGMTAVVQSDGSFSQTYHLPDFDYGIGTAVATDGWGLQSEFASVTVDLSS